MRSRSALAAFCCSWLVMVFLTGCGLTGGTSARRVELHPEIKRGVLARAVRVGSVEARPGAGTNRAIGAYNFGRFEESDVATLRDTLRLSLPTAPAENPVAVHVTAQHFALTFTNNRVTGLAIIDWCVADGASILASERFYAAYDSGEKLFGTETLGMAKNRILHAASARIAERSLAVANALPVPPAPALTFDDPAAAASTLPIHRNATGAPGLIGSVVQQEMLGGLEGATKLLPEPIPPPTDWPARLGAPGSGR